MSNDRNRIIEKIQKLLALAKDGSNIHESARAAAQAEAMMRKYQLDHAEILVDRLSKADIEDRQFARGERSVPSWISILAFGVAMANECEVTRFRAEINFYGTPEDVAVAYEMMVYLVGEVDRLTRRHEGTRGQKGAFRRGCAAELQRRLNDIAAQRRREFENTSAGTALVLKKQDLIEQHLGRKVKYSNLKSSEAFSGSYQKGRQAAAGVNLNAQISGSSRRRIA